MSNVPITDATGTDRKVDTISRTDGGNTVETQAIAVIDPVTGTPIDFATQTTLAALLVAANAIKAAAEALNTKTTAVDTAAVAGTVALDTIGTHYSPGFDIAAGAGAGGTLRTDPDGNLVARSQVLTDELGYRANFANTSLSVSVGTATFVNGSNAVTGTGFISADLRTDDYVKLDADPDSKWAQIGTLDSDTQITLVSPYTGTSGTGATSRAILKPSAGTGGTISVASGVCTIASGTTANAISEVERDVDWLPLVKQSGVAISQRIVNQSIQIGLYDESSPAAPKWFAWFVADGTVATTIKCQSGRNPTTAPSASEIEETIVTLPNGASTATSRRLRTEVLGDRVNFLIDGVTVATHYRAMPGPGDLLTSSVRVVNGATPPASSTNVVIDYDTVKNHNKLEVGLLSDVENIVATAAPLQAFSYNVAGVIAINTDLLIIDCLQIRSLFIQCASMGTTGVATVQWCNEPTFATPITATLLSEAGAASTTFNAAVLRATNVLARYCRIRLTTATTAGTTTLNVWGAQTPYTPIVTTQPVSGTVGVTGYPTAAASADALANPTVTQLGALGLLFNGTTWDRSRNNFNALTGDTGTKTTSFAGATQTNFNAAGVAILINMGVVTGTTPTFAAQVQISPDGGTTWKDVPGAVTPTINASGTTLLVVYPGVTPSANAAVSHPLPRTWRLNYTIGGGTPSFTITNVQTSYIN